MKHLTYEQTYERIIKVLEEVTEELGAIQDIDELNDDIKEKIVEVDEEIKYSLEDDLVKQIIYSIREESIEIDKELEGWIEDFLDKRVKDMGLNEEKIVDYLDFIKDVDKKEEAVILLRNIIEGPELEQYRNLKAFFDFLQQELEEDMENAPETLQIKQRELFTLISESIIDIEPTDIFYLGENTQVDIKQHALYLGFKSAAEDISPDDFENFYREVKKQITNPYTKIGMNLLYLSKLEEYAKDNPNYKPSPDLLNDAIPYLILKTSLIELGPTSMMSGEFSNVFSEECDIYNNIYFVNFYSHESYIDMELYTTILKNSRELNPVYLKLIRNLAQGKAKESINTILNDVFGDFIENQMNRPREGKITEAEFLALILQSLEISTDNFLDNIQNVKSIVTEQETLSKDDLIKISNLMFYIEQIQDLPIEMKKMLSKVSNAWLNVYIDNSDTKELRDITESICDQAMQLDDAQIKINLTDEEIEEEMMDISQDFYKEYVAAYILTNLSEKAEAQIYKYSNKFQEDGISKDRYLEGVKYTYSNPETFGEKLELFNQDTQEWIKSLISLNEDKDRRDIDCSYIITLIFSMKDQESIKQAIEILYNIIEGDENKIYRESSKLIDLIQKELSDEESRLNGTEDSAELAGKKLLLLNVMFTLPEDLKYIEDSENSYFHTVLRPDTEVKDHGKYFAFISLMDNMSPEQFEKFYNEIRDTTSSDNIKAGLDMYYTYSINNYMHEDDDFSPEIKRMESKLPVILAESYMSKETPLQMYQSGAFTTAFKHDIPSSIDTIVTSNYISRFEIDDDLYSVIANRCDAKEVSEDTIGALKGLGALRDLGENSEFYKKYIKKFCGDFIENQRVNLLPPDPAGEYEVELETESENVATSQNTEKEQTNADTTTLSKAYIAMLLNTSIYDKFNERNIQDLKKLNEKIKTERVSSSNLFDIGSYLMFIEKSIFTAKGQLKVSKILEDLGENWMECYLDGGKIPMEMRENLAILLNTLEKEFSYEER